MKKPPSLTPDETKNGWTAEALAAYRAEREQAFNKVAGNIVTSFVRPKARPRIEGARSYNPHRRKPR